MSVAGTTSRLVQAATAVAQTDKPDDAALALVQHIAESVGSEDVSLWLFERDDARFASHASLIPGRWSGLSVALKAFPLPRGVFASSGRAGSAMRRDSTSARDFTQLDNGTLVIGRRACTAIGFLLIADRSPPALVDIHRTELELCGQLLVQIYQREFAYNFLQASQTPLTFHGSEQELFDSVILQVAGSSRMEFAVLREHDAASGALRTLQTWGFDVSLEPSRFDLAPVSNYPPLHRALQGETVVARSIDEPGFESMAAFDFAPVQSFVAMPIRVGDEIFGVLSVGATYEYDYNTLECRAFEGLANAAGLAIRYFRSNHDVTRQVREFTEVSTALTAVEVAQSARHEALVKIGNAGLALANVKTALGKGNVALATQRLGKLQSDNEEIVTALNKIRLATAPVSDELAEAGIKEVWQEARNATAGKLAHLRVHVTIEGADRKVLVFPDRIRQVFINLFLNSADAFETTSRSFQRKIVVRVDPNAPPEGTVSFTYRDNAGGLQAQLLRGHDGSTAVPIERLVFVKGVTSKPAGTGYGLWLADRFMQQHAGSIAVLERREGMMFGLELPNPATVHLVNGVIKRIL